MTICGDVLITGGSGTLGHAIVRTAVNEGWDCRFTIMSRSELRLATMQQLYPGLRYIVGDVRDYVRVRQAVRGQDVVIHAAAMKRIPECEASPTECVATNVLGSSNVVRACLEAKVPICIGVSTDKACGAITAYGASKRLMETEFQHSSNLSTTFTLVRYGNVVGSNGSVVPIWRHQASQGEPLTITDARCTRFWMSETAAVRTIAAAFSAPPGYTVVPKVMGLSLIELAELVVPGAVYRITGVRSREKLHEELIHPDEPAYDLGDDSRYMYILPTGSPGGIFYTSANAPRMTAEAFVDMLAEADEVPDAI